MDGERRPRTRGPRCGRGVRVRGGRGKPVGPPPVAIEEVAVVPDRGRPSRRGRKRRGRAFAGQKRPGPRTMEELVICHIMGMPDGQALETTVGTKRRLQLSNLAPAPPPPSPPPPSPPPPSLPTASTSTSQQYVFEYVIENASVSPGTEIAPPLSSECWMSSPEIFVECTSEDSPPSMPPAAQTQHSPPSMPPAAPTQHSPPSMAPAAPTQHSPPSMAPAAPTQHSPSRPPSNLLNYGSDSGSDDSDDDVDLVCPFIPRVFRSTWQTLMDMNEDVVTFDQPTSSEDPAPAGYDFNWTPFPDSPIPPESRRETFSESNVGPKIPCVDPYDIFVAIWDRQIMEHIASETNKYAQQLATQMFNDHTLGPNSRIGKWRDTDVDELYVFFGLILAMGIVIKTSLSEYWVTSSDVFSTPGFSAHMSISRFALLNKCLHFNDNEDMCARGLDGAKARLFKIQPILSHLNFKFQSLYTPVQNIALDESLLMWKGSLDINQLMPNKAGTQGIKTYEICESQTGYLWRFEVHAQKKSPQRQFTNPLEAPTPSIVLRLIKGLEHKGYTLWMDSYYNSPYLARHLKSLGIDCVGTMRTDRMFLPQALRSLTKQNMRPGEITGLTSGDVDVMVWRDNSIVGMISTYHGNAQQTVRGSTKPILILDYNIMMGGVDKKDQMLAMYPIERKRTKVWYKKLFRRLLNASVLNSYIMYKDTSSISHRNFRIAHRNFRIALVKSLLAKHFTTVDPPLPVNKPTQRVDVSHRLDKFPIGSAQRLRRVCTVCKKLASTFCVGCDKTVCMKPCFVTLHS